MLFGRLPSLVRASSSALRSLSVLLAIMAKCSSAPFGTTFKIINRGHCVNTVGLLSALLYRLKGLGGSVQDSRTLGEDRVAGCQRFELRPSDFVGSLVRCLRVVVGQVPVFCWRQHAGQRCARRPVPKNRTIEDGLSVPRALGFVPLRHPANREAFDLSPHWESTEPNTRTFVAAPGAGAFFLLGPWHSIEVKADRSTTERVFDHATYLASE
ncbi:hypothetical protein ACVWZ4_004388 [Bradyrhizobium sp. USDA 4472]